MTWLPARILPAAKRTVSTGTANFSAASAASRLFSVWQAACAALPFRSAPDDAAVADVFGTLLVSVLLVRTWEMSICNSLATTWATLVYKPWPISMPPWFTITLPSV